MSTWRDRPLRFSTSQLVANAECALREALEELSEHSASESDLAQRMRLTLWTLRKVMHRYHAQLNVKHGGGVRGKRFTLTDELLDEVCRDGVPSVARRLGVHENTIRQRLKEYVAHQRP